ncbi:MAG: hypothetical protein JWO93_2990 [Micrococcaceae bacterium]|nr:hypothetical protein [Micrococcaceae bacterium]
MVLPSLGQGVEPGNVVGLRVVPPLVLVDGGQHALHGGAFCGRPHLQFMGGLKVLLLALAEGFLARARASVSAIRAAAIRGA